MLVCIRQQWLHWGSHSYQIISYIESSEKLDLTSFLLKYPKRLKMQVKKLSCQISLRTFSGIKPNVQDRGVSWPVSMLKAATASYMTSWADVDNDFSVTLPNSLFLPQPCISRGKKDVYPELHILCTVSAIMTVFNVSLLGEDQQELLEDSRPLKIHCSSRTPRNNVLPECRCLTPASN